MTTEALNPPPIAAPGHFGCPRGRAVYHPRMSLGTRGAIDQGDLALSFAHLLRDDLTCAALVLDEHGLIVSSSPNATTLLGLPMGSLTGTHLSQLPPEIRSLLDQVSLPGQAFTPNSTALRPPPVAQNLRFRCLPLDHSHGATRRMILIQDLSVARRLEADIRQLDRLASVGTLAAEMAHEVKNALVAVKTFADLLVEQNQDAELADTVRRETRRIESIVSQVLKYSRPSAPSFQPVGMHGLLDRCLKMLKPRLDGRNLNVVSRFAATPDIVNGDEHHLEQAVINLLLNAAEATNGHGTVTVETALVTGQRKDTPQFIAAREVRVSIRDTGPGIAADDMAHLFEPFFSTKKQGTGLGLAITRRIIHEHHGLISAESDPGRGATFHILLPAA
jgi:two-component system nitrogen regulation sensor histidine kinase GlnL